MNKIKQIDFKILIIIILMGILFFIKACEKPSIQAPTPVKTEIEVRSSRDTVFYEKKVYIPVIQKDTSPTILKQYGDTLINLKRNEYSQSIEDTILKGTISSTVDGMLIDTKLEYVLKNNIKYITKTDSVFITNTYKAQNKRSIVFGLEVGTNLKQVQISPLIQYYNKQNTGFGIRYEFPTKSVNIMISKKINIGK
jgi:hypothetical protein